MRFRGTYGAPIGYLADLVTGDKETLPSYIADMTFTGALEWLGQRLEPAELRLFEPQGPVPADQALGILARPARWACASVVSQAI